MISRTSAQPVGTYRRAWASSIALTALQGTDDALQVKRDESVVIVGASGNGVSLPFSSRNSVARQVSLSLPAGTAASSPNDSAPT